MDVSIDPTDPTTLCFLYEEGLLELRNGEVVRVLNATNSNLNWPKWVVPALGREWVDFDTDGNL